MTMPNNLVYEQERLDELHRNGYFIIQDPKRFCFGMDAVLLSGFAKAKKGERVLDLVLDHFTHDLCETERPVHHIKPASRHKHFRGFPQNIIQCT